LNAFEQPTSRVSRSLVIKVDKLAEAVGVEFGEALGEMIGAMCVLHVVAVVNELWRMGGYGHMHAELGLGRE